MPISRSFDEYAQKLRMIFRKQKIYVDVGVSGEVQLLLRCRTGGDAGPPGEYSVSIDEAVVKPKQLKENRGIHYPFQRS
jgi:hypothetical protein